jgi:dienelactone hydrolase
MTVFFSSGCVRWMKRITALLCMLAFDAIGAEPIEHFTDWPVIDSVVISPSGKRLAMLLPGVSGFKKLGVMDLDPLGKPRIVAGFGDADVTDVQWVSEDRLVYGASMRGAYLKQGSGGAFAVNHDGAQPRQLIAWRSNTQELSTQIVSRVLSYDWRISAPVDDGSNEVFVHRVIRDAKGDATHRQLARLNTSTGQLRQMNFGMPEGAQRWLFGSKNEPVVVTAELAGRTKIYLRKAGAEEWTLVSDVDALEGAGFTPWLVDSNGSLLVNARMNDESSLHRYDREKKEVEPEPTVRVAGFDLRPTAEVDPQTGRLVGLHFRADRGMSYWFDEKLQRIQQAVDAALPGRVNRLSCGRCESSRFLVVRSMSDRQPGEYLLFDREKLTLSTIGVSRPWIDEATQGRRTSHRVKARDGLSIPVYVTHPAGSTPGQALPAVVLVHGGPWLRGSGIEWEPEAQFLASRGYRVIQPEFRGSEGYGWKHFHAGWKQWGRAMQDDLLDAVLWAAKEGLVDAGRVCIMGASYGGYAALMGPIAHPSAYRCAISFAGVTDIDLMYDINWSDLSESSKEYSMPVLIGDREKDATYLASVSPLKRAAEIKVPVLVAYGGEDVRVPMAHAKKFIAAATRAGVAVEDVPYLDEGHGFNDNRNRADFYRRIEAFLEKALKPAQ